MDFFFFSTSVTAYVDRMITELEYDSDEDYDTDQWQKPKKLSGDS
jgi:hypothetical protein